LKPSIPKGTRDFSPAEMAGRNYILDAITTVFRRYGFRQIETPAMENIATLTGKYGEEGDQLIYKILNSRMHESKDKEQLIAEFNKSLEKNYNSELLTERALRYDLTVPFARYVVMHQNEITFPFRRYQVQPVWRADRPQKGRYREFYQCDADVIGSVSLLNEVELVLMMTDVFKRLGLNVTIKFNNRKLLTAFAEQNGHLDKIIDLTVAIDKIEKIGIEKVKEELQLKGFTLKDLAWISEISKVKGDTNGTIEVLENYFRTSDAGKQGLNEIKNFLGYFKSMSFDVATLELDVTLARGLNYYTGTIFEVKVNDPASTFSGSILGGGRYDDLTGIFGLPGVSGVGISFGLDRIYDVMDELKLFEDPALSNASTQVLFVNFGDEEEKYCLKLLAVLRSNGVNAEIYPDQVKMKKQMSYADNNKIPYVVLAGKDEMASGLLSVKNMTTGTQEKMSIEQLISKLKKT
jgi:histidyl-tRNA synthetase